MSPEGTVRSYAAMRRRLYLMRHGAVSYFAPGGRPVDPEGVPLNEEGRAQAAAARTLLEPVRFDRVLASGLPRTLETARSVAPGATVEEWPDLRELRGDRLSGISPDELEHEFVHAFRGVVPNDRRFLGGETVGELFERVLPALERLLEDRTWDTLLAVLHGGVNRAILSHALTGERMFLGHFEQAPGCVNVLDVGDEWPGDAIVRAVNIAPLDLLHAATRQTTMEGYWEEYTGTIGDGRDAGALGDAGERGPAPPATS
jgi:probable phosphoglycerate mutase